MKVLTIKMSNEAYNELLTEIKLKGILKEFNVKESMIDSIAGAFVHGVSKNLNGLSIIGIKEKEKS